MKQVVVVYNPKELLGESVKVFMKDGGKFHFKVMECGGDYMNGYDEEGMDLHLKIEDIDFVVV